ncbi:MAG TPA: hypothetical protein PKY81_05455, partial [bacterium]|nr:hypothetical protein [bacterium]
MYKVLAIIQARMGSSRVPGKSLRKICGLPVIHHIFNRVSAAKNVDKTILATADTDADKPLIEYCLNNNIPVVAGSENDLAERFNDVIKKYPAENIIRICGDQILHSSEIIDLVVNEHLESNKDYTTTGYYE